MKIQLPKPFLFEEGKRAVLLLHGFTGNSSDVRQLGRFLQKKWIYVLRTSLRRACSTARRNFEVESTCMV